MNIRKPVDFSEMYLSLDMAVAGKYAQMQMYAMIGQAVTTREEKGAAVAAADYLQMRYPDMSGFSPRNLRRMREFYRTYAQDKALLHLAMQIGWTQNVVILEADLTMEERCWYMKRVAIHGWTKTQLVESIQKSLHLSDPLDEAEHLCYTVEEPIDVEKPDEESIICEPVGLASGTVCAVSIRLFNRSICLLYKTRFGIEKCRLRQLRPPDRDGTGRYPGSVLYLWWRLCGKDMPPDRVYRQPGCQDCLTKHAIYKKFIASPQLLILMTIGHLLHYYLLKLVFEDVSLTTHVYRLLDFILEKALDSTPLLEAMQRKQSKIDAEYPDTI